MRTLAKNKVPMKYALYLGTEDVIATDDNGEPIVEHIDEQGNIYYRLETVIKYSEPVDFFASISMSGGESEAVEFGVDIGNYDAVVITALNEFPISETSFIWTTSEPQYTAEGRLNTATADFRVKAVKPSLNQTKLLLSAITK